jgi:hypothetical protein
VAEWGHDSDAALMLSQDQIYTSTDIAVLLDEVRACQDLLNRITQMKLGYLGTALVTITDKVSCLIAPVL